MKECKLINIKTFQNRGYSLTPIELKDVVPFEVKRIYYMELPENSVTGEHSHKIEEEVFFQVKGKSIIIIDRGAGKEDVALEPGAAIYVPAYVWHGFKETSNDCLILAASSTNYQSDRSDYIESYDEYLQIRDKKL